MLKCEHYCTRRCDGSIKCVRNVGGSIHCLYKCRNLYNGVQWITGDAIWSQHVGAQIHIHAPRTPSARVRAGCRTRRARCGYADAQPRAARTPPRPLRTLYHFALPPQRARKHARDYFTLWRGRVTIVTLMGRNVHGHWMLNRAGGKALERARRLAPYVEQRHRCCAGTLE
jgi:hypothetical protein